MKQLHDDLSGYSLRGIEWALDSWGRNADQLPSLAKLLQLLQTWNFPSASRRDGPGCEQCNQGWIVTNPEKKVCDWIMKPCACIADRSLRKEKTGVKMSAEEWKRLTAEIDRKMGVDSKRYPNGNPRMNIPLTQARALQTVGS